MLTDKFENILLQYFSVEKPELTLLKRNLLLTNPRIFLKELKETKNCHLLDPKVLSQGFGTSSSVKFLLTGSSTACYISILASVLMHRRVDSYTVTRGLRLFTNNLHYVLFGTAALYGVKVKKHYDLIDSIVEKSSITKDECLSLLDRAYSGEIFSGDGETRRTELFNEKKNELDEAVEKLRVKSNTAHDHSVEGELQEKVEEVVLSRNFKTAFDLI